GRRVASDALSRSSPVLAGPHPRVRVWLELSRNSVTQRHTSRKLHSYGAGMSGYLQRLVQTAAHPVQTVHPFAGSIYALRSDNESHGFESGESVTAAPSPSARAAATSQQQNVSTPIPRRRDTVPTREYHPIAPVSAATPSPSEGNTDAMRSWEEQRAETPY